MVDDLDPEEFVDAALKNGAQLKQADLLIQIAQGASFSTTTKASPSPTSPTKATARHGRSGRRDSVAGCCTVISTNTAARPIKTP